jgi:hypothetical protein
MYIIRSLVSVAELCFYGYLSPTYQGWHIGATQRINQQCATREGLGIVRFMLRATSLE